RAPAEATASARAPANAASSRPQTAPWHGPIVAVVYRLRISEDRQPSCHACSRSCRLTSSHRHTYPSPAIGTLGGSVGGSGWPFAARLLLASASSRVQPGTTTSPAPTIS